MDVLFTLIPLSIALIFVVIGVLCWAVFSGQFDDVEAQGGRIIEDVEGGRTVGDVERGRAVEDAEGRRTVGDAERGPAADGGSPARVTIVPRGGKA